MVDAVAEDQMRIVRAGDVQASACAVPAGSRLTASIPLPIRLTLVFIGRGAAVPQ
jgi:hypothetical protein